MSSYRPLSDQYNTCHIGTAANLDHHLYRISANAPGKFVHGACADKLYRQVVTSAGSDCMTAQEAERRPDA